MPRGLGQIKGMEFYGEWKAAKKTNRLGLHKNNGVEIVLVSKGKLNWEVETREVRLQANMLFYTLPWQEHGGVEEMQPSCEISYLCLTMAKTSAKPQRHLRFHPVLGLTAAEERVISSALIGNRTQAIPAGPEVISLFSQFFALAYVASPLRQSRARDIIKLILSHLATALITGRKSESRMVEAERRVRKLADLLLIRFAEPWTLKSMSDACRLGRTQFSQLLKRHTGDSPITFLNRTRVREAQRLLRDSTKSITDIALETGFNSSQYFATVFKEFTDMDARSFRSQP